ncbi:unnamed protein product [Diamesa serratosioi]
MNPAGNSTSSSFEDLGKESEVKERDMNPEFVDILGNGQLTKKVLVKGKDDTRPERLNICTIKLVGSLEDGTIVEDYLDNFTIQIGDVEIIQGLDLAIALMNVGEKAEVKVISRFAYGALGLPSNSNANSNVISIPGDATLTYIIELISVDEEPEDKSYIYRKKTGNKKRERGNFWFERQEFNLGIQCYRRALEYLDDTEGGITAPLADGEHETTNSQLQDLLEDRIKVYNNLAMAQMKIGAFDVALQSVEKVLMCQPNNVKALFRKGKILETKGETLLAIPILQKAATLDANNKSIQNELSKLILKSKREARDEKDMYQKMLGAIGKMEKKVSHKKTVNVSVESSSRVKLLSYTLGSILIAVAAVSFYRYSNK